MADTEYRLAVATLTADQLNSGDYLIEDRETADDSVSVELFPWMVLDNPDMYPRRASYDITVGARQKPNGLFQFSWLLAPLTFHMKRDFEADTFGDDEDVAVTVKTLTANNDYDIYHARLLRPVPGVHYKLVDGVIQGYTLRFLDGERIATGLYI